MPKPMPKLMTSLNPYDLDHAGSTDENGVPFFLAKTTPKKLKANDGTVFTPSYAQPSVFEEIAKVKKPLATKTGLESGIKDVLKIKTPSANDINNAISMKGSNVISAPHQAMQAESENPMDQLKSDYLTFMQNRMARQKELDSDYDKLKAQERPSGFANLDLTPAFAFVDQMTGSKLTPSYKAPTAAKEFDAKLKAAQELALMNGDKLSGDQFAAMGFDEKNRQYDDGQLQENARLDKTLRNAIEVAKINADARIKSPGLNPSLLYRMGRDFQQDVKDYATAVTPQAEFASSIDSVLTQISLKPDLPGLGWDKANPLGWVTDRAYSDNGELKRSVQKVGDAYRKVISGTAASDSERSALDYLSGNTGSITKEGLVKAMGILQDGVASRNKSIAAGYPKKVVETYENRGGMKIKPSSTPVGTIEDGYRFIGGDDKESKNWVKVK